MQRFDAPKSFIPKSIAVFATVVLLLVTGAMPTLAAPTSVTYTLTEDFNNNAVVGPDLEFGTADDGDAGPSADIDNSRPRNDQVDLKALEFSSIGVGDYYTISGVKADGTLWMSGDNWAGQICTGDNTERTELTKIGTDTNWQYSDSGMAKSHMIKSDGTLWACGSGSTGELGIGDGADYNSPTQVGTDSDWVTVSGGGWHGAAIKDDGSLWTWGSDWCGVLGQGTEDVQQNSPVRVGADNDWAAVTSGDLFLMALKDNGTLWSWGCDSNGELGHGTTGVDAHVPTQVGTDTDWALISANSETSAAIKTNGTLWTWGFNNDAFGTDGDGMLGHGDTLNRNVPTQVGTDTDWATVSVGFYHMMAIRTDGSLWTWGNQEFGEGGLGASAPNVLSPMPVGNDEDWASVTAGETISVAVKEDDSVWATGQFTPFGDVTYWDLLYEFTEVYYPPYYTTGSLAGLKVYAGAGNTADWTGLSWNSEALPVDTEIRFRVRTSDDDVTYSAWSDYFTQDLDASTTGTADLTSITDSAYLEMELSFTTADELVTPELLDFTLDYDPEAGVGGGGGATAPTLTSAAATGVGETTATLNGEITAIGSQAPTQRGFEFGLTNAYGDTVTDAGSFAVGTFSQTLINLTCNTTYHYRAIAISPDGTGTGADQTFTTAACQAGGGGGSTTSGSVTNPHAPIAPVVAPILPIITPLLPSTDAAPAPAAAANISNTHDSSPNSESLDGQQDGPGEPVPSLAQPHDETPFEPVNVIPLRGESTRNFDALELVSGWYSAAARFAPMSALSSTGLVMLAALLPLAVTTSAFALSMAAIPLGLSGLQLIYSRHFQNLLSFLGLRKKRHVWGTVYDSQTKQPLDPAVVELIDATTGEVMERAITDLAGRYGFLTREGTFLLRASKTHYSFPSQKETAATDEIFDNLYHGEKLTLSEGSTLVVPNIPMDPVGFDWNQEAKQKLLPSRLRLHYLVQVLFDLVFALGFSFAVYNVANHASIWNYAALGLYGFILVLRLLIGHKHLWGMLTKGGQPFSGAKIELQHPKFNVIMGKALTSPDGKFFLKVPEPGDYRLSVKSSDGAEVLSGRMVEVGKDSVLNANIEL